MTEIQGKGALEAEATVEPVLKELSRIGFSDLRRVFDANGRLLRPEEWDDDTAAARGADPARNIMLRGGSRSGKTFVLCRAMLQKAISAPGSRHVIVRFRFNHAKTSVWFDTLPKVLVLCLPSVRVRFDKTEFYAELPNGSQIWIAGVDDKERVEKTLGQEYATLSFNASSQIPRATVETAMSRWRRHANSLQRSPPRQAEGT